MDSRRVALPSYFVSGKEPFKHGFAKQVSLKNLDPKVEQTIIFGNTFDAFGQQLNFEVGTKFNH